MAGKAAVAAAGVGDARSGADPAAGCRRRLGTCFGRFAEVSAELISRCFAADVFVPAAGEPPMGAAATGEGDGPRAQCGPGDFDDLSMGAEPGETGDEARGGRLIEGRRQSGCAGQ
ncbi:hypothetical protein [Streptomyces sp. NPDC001401]|uniref:hypothetical protein n=1 Tax=Streptomyces sp. NPDC001401 TaxID=3364570 RepID=UPI0036BD8D0F